MGYEYVDFSEAQFAAVRCTGGPAAVRARGAGRDNVQNKINDEQQIAHAGYLIRIKEHPNSIP